jgi:hypothetical protein
MKERNGITSESELQEVQIERQISAGRVPAHVRSPAIVLYLLYLSPTRGDVLDEYQRSSLHPQAQTLTLPHRLTN